ncbi:MAG TPA: HDIG domain-containing protein [Candidatus Bathyarchaeia archaeon]|nr:HDIG domain-containing protein [Candidatus Bathyarchaeia archaeon]
MNERLKKLVNKIKNGPLRKKTLEFLENPTIKIGGKTYSGLPLSVSPAGLSRHHSYPGGFVEHVAATAEIALNLCDVAEGIYGGKVNKDFVLSGILLHDILKPLTYTQSENRSYTVTPLGDYLDHLSLIVSEMVKRGFPLEVVHIVAAHHGGEAGPVWPRTAEALICHLADLVDSRLNGEVLRAARYLSRQETGIELPMLTSKEAFEIVHSKTSRGWNGVKNAVEKIEKKRLKGSRTS